MTTASPRSAWPSGTRRALSRAEQGKTLDVDEIATLLQLRDEPLRALMDIAGSLRDEGLRAAGRPGVVTYSRKVFVPLTRLCRDRCHYCTFATGPASVPSPYLSPDDVLSIARAGAAMQCKEALFTLGDRPEDRWPQAREWLHAQGYDSTLEYVRAMAVLVLEETGLLPHLNPGVMSWQELQRLKPVSASMGLMLETTSERLWSTPGAVHHGSPDKQPAVRLRVLTDAGRLGVPFTTGLLVGIGESPHERAESLLALRAVSRAYGHVQEVLVQNFRAKPDTAMRHADDLSSEDHLAAVAAARVVLGPHARVQVPPNLSEPETLQELLAAGVDDWGGVSPLTPDHVNPERPWPQIDELARATSSVGLSLRERLAVHPSYVRAGEPWIDPRITPHVRALADADGLAVEGRVPVGMPWQEPDDAWDSSGRTQLHVLVDSVGRTDDRRSDFADVYGDWESVRAAAARTSAGGSSSRTDGTGRAALARAENDPASLLQPQHEDEALTLLHAEGDLLAELTTIADAWRQRVVGDTVTYVVNRNINFTNVCYTGCRFCAFAQRRTDPDAYTLSLGEVADRAREAHDLGATEVCMQGGIDPALPGSAYADLVRAVKDAVPALHVHAFSPMEVANAASRLGLPFDELLASWRDAGLGSIPGTAAEILDDEVRWVLTRGKLPTATWVDVVTSAHRVGLRSSATMMYGHVDAPHHWLQHFRVLAQVQDRAREAGVDGFTEFVPLPFVHRNAPVYLAGAARPGPTPRENLVVHAMARVLLHGRVDHVQTSWVKLGTAGAQVMLRAGADDLGGTLMEETISRMAGSEHGSARTVAELAGIAEGIGRPSRERTTTYRVPARAGVAPDADPAGPSPAGRTTDPTLPRVAGRVVAGQEPATTH